MSKTNLSINAIKTGNVVHISVGGKLNKKCCASEKEADELYRLCLQAKDNPSPENLKAIRMVLNEKVRVAMKCGLESDVETEEVFLAGFNTPIPESLWKLIEEYFDRGYPVKAIENFWKLLMINPDKRVRVSLFDFIMKHDFVITDTGYFIAYKAVLYAEEGKKDNDLAEYVTNQVLHVRKDWKCNPNKYVVYADLSDGTFHMTKETTAKDWDEKNVQIMGKLGDLALNIDTLPDDSKSLYTDMYTHKMQIRLGFPTMQKRKECDANPGKDCSKGLHVGATSYVEQYGKDSHAVLVCLINPANVVSVPDHDKTKIRVCEYFPFAKATYVDEKIDIIEQPYFENDYKTYEEESLAKMIEKVKANELPIEKAINCHVEEERPMAELMTILKNRVFVLNQ